MKNPKQYCIACMRSAHDVSQWVVVGIETLNKDTEEYEEEISAPLCPVCEPLLSQDDLSRLLQKTLIEPTTTGH